MCVRLFQVSAASTPLAGKGTLRPVSSARRSIHRAPVRSAARAAAQPCPLGTECRQCSYYVPARRPGRGPSRCLHQHRLRQQSKDVSRWERARGRRRYLGPEENAHEHQEARADAEAGRGPAGMIVRRKTLLNRGRVVGWQVDVHLIRRSGDELAGDIVGRRPRSAFQLNADRSARGPIERTIRPAQSRPERSQIGRRDISLDGRPRADRRSSAPGCRRGVPSP